MESFKLFIEHQEFFDKIINEFNGVPSVQAAQNHNKVKPWSAKKPEIMQMWQNLQPNTPITMMPIMDVPDGQEHSTYGEDGIRITGSWYFISSVMAKIKDIVHFENPQNKLRLVLRAVSKDKVARNDRQSYVFYCNLENRAKGKAGRPTNLKLPKPAI